MMSSKTVYVYVKLAENSSPVIAGKLEFFGDRIDFRYGRTWLSNPSGFALHPDLLPLCSTTFSSMALDGALGAFKDAGPGLWGKELIKRQYGQVDPADYLLLSNNLLRIGVFRFAKEADALFDGDTTPFQIDDIYAAIQAMDSGGKLTDFQTSILVQGSSMDGMRPKSFVEIDGQSWIMKFPSKNDYENKATCELIGMELARACGIETPDVKLVQLNNGKQAVAIRRFDVDGQSNIPLMSAASAMGYVEGEVLKKDYRYMAQMLSRFSVSPQKDRQSLFRRMALNVMISNRDDHIFNQALIMKNGKWQLSPVYDVVCGEGNRRDHAMNIGKFGAAGNLANVISSAGDFGLDAKSASDVVDDMLDVVTQWKAIAKDAGIPESDISGVEWAILHKDIFNSYKEACKQDGKTRFKNL